jgi:hypothetical protein
MAVSLHPLTLTGNQLRKWEANQVNDHAQQSQVWVTFPVSGEERVTVLSLERHTCIHLLWHHAFVYRKANTVCVYLCLPDSWREESREVLISIVCLILHLMFTQSMRSTGRTVLHEECFFYRHSLYIQNKLAVSNCFLCTSSHIHGGVAKYFMIASKILGEHEDGNDREEEDPSISLNYAINRLESFGVQYGCIATVWTGTIIKSKAIEFQVSHRFTSSHTACDDHENLFCMCPSMYIDEMSWLLLR